MSPRKLLRPFLARLNSEPAGAAAVVLFYELGILLYSFLRANADDLGRPTSSAAPVESFLFHGFPSLWLQRWTPNGLGFEWLAVLFHLSWFIGPPLLLWAVYARSGRGSAARLVALEMVLLLSAVLVFALLPTRPPWMDLHLKRVILVGYGSTASLDNNIVASAPSLHVAVPALYTLWFARESSSLRRLTPVLALWTLGIAWASVYGGEHYMVGAMAGAAWAAATYAVCYVATGLRSELAVRRDMRPRALAPGHLPQSIGRSLQAEE